MNSNETRFDVVVLIRIDDATLMEDETSSSGGNVRPLKKNLVRAKPPTIQGSPVPPGGRDSAPASLAYHDHALRALLAC